MTTDGGAIEILLVEDSPTDALMTQEALAHAKVLNRLHLVEDGERAMAFLRRRAPFESVPRPGLVLLDLNLPRKSGREVLAEIKADASLRAIPVVVLTASKAEEDVARSYGLHANCYITKPVEFDKLAEVVRQIHQFWFTVVTLPPAAGAAD